MYKFRSSLSNKYIYRRNLFDRIYMLINVNAYITMQTYTQKKKYKYFMVHSSEIAAYNYLKTSL